LKRRAAKASFYIASQPKTTLMEESSPDGNKKIYVAIIALLLLINGVALYLLYSENKSKKDLTAQKITLENDFKNLSDTLDAKIADLDQFKGRNAVLDSIIVEQQAEIEKQKKTISGLFSKGKMTASELAKAKTMIAEYESSIAEMKKRVEQLVAEKDQLTAQNQQLSTDLTNEKQTTSQLSEQNKGLSRKVELASLLQLRNIEVVGIKKKDNGKDVTVSKVKQLESLRISFETGDNKILDAGNLSLYIRILNPKGETISVADQGSGNFTPAGTNESAQYTKKADIDWNQSNKKITVYWSQNIKEPGTYKAEIYQSGVMIGQDEVTLK
jgi:hypothetical protein